MYLSIYGSSPGLSGGLGFFLVLTYSEEIMEEIMEEGKLIYGIRSLHATHLHLTGKIEEENTWRPIFTHVWIVENNLILEEALPMLLAAGVNFAIEKRKNNKVALSFERLEDLKLWTHGRDKQDIVKEIWEDLESKYSHWEDDAGEEE